jgi:hypothetical protein
MPMLRITVFGLEGLDSRELEELISGLAPVDEVVTHNSMDDIEPGVIYASALHVTYIVTFLGAGVTAVALGAAQEMGKDIYLAAKKTVQGKVKIWVSRKNAKAPDRIHLVMSDDGELFISRYRNRPKRRR